jgi:hypothetical protein
VKDVVRLMKRLWSRGVDSKKCDKALFIDRIFTDIDVLSRKYPPDIDNTGG